MKKLIGAILTLSALTGASMAVVSCGSQTNYSYKGAGSKWSAALNANGTFRLEETTATPNLVIEGTYTTLSTGFLKLTVTNASGANAPSAGDAAYALNVPGVILIVKPIGNDSNQLIPMVAAGACPTGDADYNWIDMALQTAAFNEAENHLAGTFRLRGTAASLPTKYYENGTSTGSGQDLGTINCTDGVATFSGETDGAVLYMTANTGAIVHSTNVSNKMMVLAMEQATLSGASGLQGDYAGLVFAGDDTPVSASISSTGQITVQSINVETGVQEGGITSTTVDMVGSVNSPENGFIRYQFTSATTEKVLCIASENLFGTGKKAIFCAGDSPSTDEGAGKVDLFTALFISK